MHFSKVNILPRYYKIFQKKEESIKTWNYFKTFFILLFTILYPYSTRAFLDIFTTLRTVAVIQALHIAKKANNIPNKIQKLTINLVELGFEIAFEKWRNLTLKIQFFDKYPSPPDTDRVKVLYEYFFMWSHTIHKLHSQQGGKASWNINVYLWEINDA